MQTDAVPVGNIIYIAHENYGLGITVYRIVWTIFAAFICYEVFKLTWLRQLIITHPEIHLFTLALVLLMSLYNRSTLMDMPVIHWLKEPYHSRADKTRHKKQSANIDSVKFDTMN